MCGITGIVSREKIIKTEIIRQMMRKISHRGPDDSGDWVSPSGQAVLGHNRLSIIDLSPAGHQPFLSADGRYTIVYNGEIYNFQELRAELEAEGYGFNSKSDTEVLLHSFIEWKEKCLDRLNGMFAFAIWDESEKTLFAARDRLGEKPFKYYVSENGLVFASELKAILKFPGVKREVDWQAIDVALGLRFVPSPATGFKDIFKLPAGHFLVWKDGKTTIKRYWNPGDIKIDDKKTFDEWKKEAWELFVDSVKKRMVSDVPLGSFLSGGIDSTSVVAAMAEISDRPVETFVISMNGKSEDQKFAGIAANHFKTNHHEIEINDIDYADALRKLINSYDEPFFDQSALPSLLISEHIKKYVTVVLSGDGGDELLGGYDSYKFINFLEIYHQLPGLVRNKIIPAILSPFKNLQYRSEVLKKDFFSAYVDYYSVWKSALPKSSKYLTKAELYRDNFKKKIDMNTSSELMEKWFESGGCDMTDKAMLADIRSRLADGYLAKMDIATMANAVEVRPPFLDFRLVELFLSMPSRFKIKGNKKKFIWLEIIKDKLPAEIIKRPKVGFSVPLSEIIKNQLKDMVNETILKDDCLISEIFSTDIIKKLWRDHLDDKADYSNHLWSLLILELWLRKYQEK